MRKARFGSSNSNVGLVGARNTQSTLWQPQLENRNFWVQVATVEKSVEALGSKLVTFRTS